MNILLIAPARTIPGLDDVYEGARVALYEDLDEVLGALRQHHGPAVLWSDDVDPAWAERVAAAVRAHHHPVIEVRSDKWDGESPSPVSAACRGVISGFGINGVHQAIRSLGSSPEVA